MQALYVEQQLYESHIITLMVLTRSSGQAEAVVRRKQVLLDLLLDCMYVVVTSTLHKLVHTCLVGYSTLVEHDKFLIV
jgi:hypothetical protein